MRARVVGLVVLVLVAAGLVWRWWRGAAPPAPTPAPAPPPVRADGGHDAAATRPPPRPDPTVLGGDFCSRDGWCWDWPHPFSAQLTGVWAHEGVVWAIGTGGMVLRRQNGAWRYVGLDTLGDLVSIWGRSADDVWVLAHDGLLAHLQGNQWTTVTQIRDQVRGTSYPGEVEFKSLWVSPGGRAWAVGGVRDDVVLGKNDDTGDRSTVSFAAVFDGTAWTLVTDEKSYPLGAVWGASESSVWACIENGACSRWTGTAFRPSKKRPPFDMYRARHGLQVTSPELRVGWRYDGRAPAGRQDRRCVLRLGRPGDDPFNACVADVRAFFAVTDDDVWAVGDLGVIQHWNGSAWAGTPGRAPDAKSLLLHDVWATPAVGGSGEVWAVGARVFAGGAFALHRRRGEREDGQDPWTVARGAPLDRPVDDVNTPERHVASGALFRVAGRAAGDVWIAGDSGGVLRWDGTSLITVAPFTKGSPRIGSVVVREAGEVYLAAGAAILHGDTTGTLARLDPPPGRGAARAAVLSPSDLWIVAPLNGVTTLAGNEPVLAHWDGTTWSLPFTGAAEHEALGLYRDVRKMVVSPAGSVWIASGERVARIAPGGKLEAIPPPADPAPQDWAQSIWAGSDSREARSDLDDVWVVGLAGVWRRTGGAWQREETPGEPWGEAIYGTADSLWVVGRAAVLRKRLPATSPAPASPDASP
jgi:hypothetical protein